MKKIRKGDFKRFYNSDRAILIACIFVAFVFWLLVKMSRPYPTTIEYDINYLLPSGKSFVSSPPQQVAVTVTGSGWDLISSSFRRRENGIEIELNDMASQGIDRNSVVERIKKTLPEDVLVRDVSTEYIFVQMEDESEKKVPILLSSEVELAPQFQYADSTLLTPDSVTITGPATEVAEIQFWETSTLNLKDVKKSQAVNLPLKAPVNKELHLSLSETVVSLAVEQFTEKSLFVPIQVRNGPDSMKVFPEMVKLTCLVGLSRFNQVNKSSFTLVADLKGIPLNTQKNTVPVSLLQYPDFVRAVNYQPKSVEFFFVETNTTNSKSPKKK